jgi:hypothetical protein
LGSLCNWRFENPSPSLGTLLAAARGGFVLMQIRPLSGDSARSEFRNLNIGGHNLASFGIFRTSRERLKVGLILQFLRCGWVRFLTRDRSSSTCSTARSSYSMNSMLA